MGKRREGREDKDKGLKGGGYGKANDGAMKIVAEEAIDGAHTNITMKEEATVVAATGATKGPKVGANVGLLATIKVSYEP